MLLPRRPSVSLFVLASITALVTVACGGGPAAVVAGEPTTVKEAFGVKCDAFQAQTAPDLMAWDAAARANLSRLRDKGIVAVRYEKRGCDVVLELLPSCKGSGSYKYTPYSATESKVASNENELFAALPLGASSFAGRVKKGQTLRTDYTMVGTDALPADKRVTRAQLRGPDCPRATHVVSTVYLGGFALAAGTKAELGGSAKVFGFGAEGESKAAGERLVAEGNAEACAEAQKTGKEAKMCAVPLRVGLLPLDGLASDGTGVAAPVPAAPKATQGPCPEGMVRIAPGSYQPSTGGGRVDLGSYCIDATEVTSAAYEACVVKGTCQAVQPVRGSNRVACNYRQAGREQHPINCVSVDQAKVYCQAQGKLLPTVNELEWAARGNVMRTYPWGEEPADGRACFGKDATCAVKSFPTGASPEGVFDLGGNVEELCESPGGGYVSFGGGYGSEGIKMAGKTRRMSTEPSPTIGFRCVSR